MTLKVLIDMNLSPSWVTVLERHTYRAVHWSTIGEPDTPDRVIMDWARHNRYIVFTHDLDFGTLLALTHAKGPSVLQIRTQEVLPAYLENTVITVLEKYEAQLQTGALIVVDESKARVRILPINP